MNFPAGRKSGYSGKSTARKSPRDRKPCSPKPAKDSGTSAGITTSTKSAKGKHTPGLPKKGKRSIDDSKREGDPTASKVRQSEIVGTASVSGQARTSHEQYADGMTGGCWGFCRKGQGDTMW